MMQHLPQNPIKDRLDNVIREVSEVGEVLQLLLDSKKPNGTAEPCHPALKATQQPRVTSRRSQEEAPPVEHTRQDEKECALAESSEGDMFCPAQVHQRQNAGEIGAGAPQVSGNARGECRVDQSMARQGAQDEG